MSPEFLFRVEQRPRRRGAGLGLRDLAISTLASRLSFFLWSSIPDDELLAAAERGELRDPAVLERQVQRMLADERATAFVENFAGQWLYLRNLDAVVPVQSDFPDFDDTLRQGLRRETELFFGSIVQEDRSALDLLRADYTFVNERVAQHYGLAERQGQSLPPRHAAGRQPAPRPARPRQHPDRHVVSRSHVARRARQVDPREPARRRRRLRRRPTCRSSRRRATAAAR